MMELKPLRGSDQDFVNIQALARVGAFMKQVDMSANAVTARLKLVSQLRRPCLSPGTAKIRTEPLPKIPDVKSLKLVTDDPEQQRK
jgi:hypothetical protein